MKPYKIWQTFFQSAGVITLSVVGLCLEMLIEIPFIILLRLDQITERK